MAITLYGNKQNIIQVVQTVKSDTFSTSTVNSWVDITGLSASITPSSANNKILVLANLALSGNQGAVGYYGRLVRNGTAVGLGNSAGSRLQTTMGLSPSSSSSYGSIRDHVTFLDSPSTTSAVTYGLQLWQITGTQAVIVNGDWNGTDGSNNGRWISTITLIEVAYS